MSWAGLIQHTLKIDTGSASLWGRFTHTMLTIILRIGVSHKVETIISFALTVASLIRRVMLLHLGVPAVLSLARLFIIRLGVLGTIRVNILNQSRHECPHVIVVAFELSQFLLQGRCWGYNY